MPEPRHAVEKLEKCSIEGCKADSARSVSAKKAEKVGMKVSGEGSRSAHLCKAHYREFKKKTKADRTFDRLGW